MALSPVHLSHFLRIEREEGGKSIHTVVHLKSPHFSMELIPDGDAPDKIGQGVIKRVCVPNSCIGDYSQYSKLMALAQEFFRQSFSEPASKSEIRRFQV